MGEEDAVGLDFELLVDLVVRIVGADAYGVDAPCVGVHEESCCDADPAVSAFSKCRCGHCAFC